MIPSWNGWDVDETHDVSDMVENSHAWVCQEQMNDIRKDKCDTRIRVIKYEWSVWAKGYSWNWFTILMQSRPSDRNGGDYSCFMGLAGPCGMIDCRREICILSGQPGYDSLDSWTVHRKILLAVWTEQISSPREERPGLSSFTYKALKKNLKWIFFKAL